MPLYMAMPLMPASALTSGSRTMQITGPGCNAGGRIVDRSPASCLQTKTAFQDGKPFRLPGSGMSDTRAQAGYTVEVIPAETQPQLPICPQAVQNSQPSFLITA